MGSIESRSGKYDSISELFEKNINKNEDDLVKIFNEEYPYREFNHYKSSYYKVYDLSLSRTSRCDKACWPEPDFKAHVIDVLKKRGYEPEPAKDVKSESGHLRLHPDIVTQKDGINYFIEVKGCYHGHRIQTGIGQLFYYEFLNKGRSGCKYVLVFPEGCKQATDFSDGFLENATSRLGMEFWFL
jgi:hypothetical protein